MTRTIHVEGMHCDGCESTVRQALEDVPGVESASADREAETATIEGDASANELVTAVEDAGYDASV